MAASTGFSLVVRAFLDKHPEMNESRGIAREIMKEHPKLFKDLDQARTSVRQVLGRNGSKSRKKLSHDVEKYIFRGKVDEKWAAENLNTEGRPWDEPFQIPKSIKHLNVIADLHSVHLDPKVMNKFLKASRNKEALLIDGDLMDSESLSRHLKGHNVIEYEKEIELAHQILKGLKQEFNHVYFKEGNHDFWLERYLLTNAREVFRLLGTSLKELLRVGELRVDHIHNLRYVTFGDMDIIHGHEFPSFGMGKFPAVGLLDKWQTFTHQYDVKVMCAHSHRHDYAISRKSKDGKFGVGYSLPAMCRKSAGFNPYAGWDNGWALLTKNDGIVDVKITVV